MKLFTFVKNSFLIMWYRHHLIIPPKYWKRYYNSFKQKISFKREFYNPLKIDEYNMWYNNVKKEEVKELAYQPLISFVIPVYNIKPEYLRDCLESILNQTYENYEICLADDHSTNEDTIKILKEYEKHPKIKIVYREENGHISKATNSALEIAKGEFIALMDDDDKITEDALYRVVLAINEDKDADFIFSDEDKEDMEGNLCEPHFKSDYATDSFYGGNYICHFTVIKRTLLDEVGYFKDEYVGAQDFDLFLRCTEKAKKIHHIPEILYHWRKVPGSTADTIENKEYAILNGKKAVEDALKRRGKDGYVTTPIKVTHYVVHYNLKENPLVSIVMIDCNQSILSSNIKEIAKLNYKNIEIVNGNENINNLIKKAKGEYILVISGKIKITIPNLLEEMLGYSVQNEIGVCAPKIYHFSKLIKTAGLILNNKNIYIDAFKDYFTDSYGMYGRLLVPFNYSALSELFMMFSKQKYEEVNGFREDMDFKLSSIDFNLKLLNKGYRNVLLSHLFVNQKDYKRTRRYELAEKEKKMLKESWNLDDDKYYNKNLNDTYNFMLEVNDIEKN